MHPYMLTQYLCVWSPILGNFHPLKLIFHLTLLFIKPRSLKIQYILHIV